MINTSSSIFSISEIQFLKMHERIQETRQRRDAKYIKKYIGYQPCDCSTIESTVVAFGIFALTFFYV